MHASPRRCRLPARRAGRAAQLADGQAELARAMRAELLQEQLDFHVEAPPPPRVALPY